MLDIMTELLIKTYTLIKRQPTQAFAISMTYSGCGCCAFDMRKYVEQRNVLSLNLVYSCAD